MLGQGLDLAAQRVIAAAGTLEDPRALICLQVASVLEDLDHSGPLIGANADLPVDLPLVLAQLLFQAFSTVIAYLPRVLSPEGGRLESWWATCAERGPRHWVPTRSGG